MSFINNIFSKKPKPRSLDELTSADRDTIEAYFEDGFEPALISKELNIEISAVRANKKRYDRKKERESRSRADGLPGNIDLFLKHHKKYEALKKMLFPQEDNENSSAGEILQIVQTLAPVITGIMTKNPIPNGNQNPPSKIEQIASHVQLFRGAYPNGIDSVQALAALRNLPQANKDNLADCYDSDADVSLFLDGIGLEPEPGLIKEILEILNGVKNNGDI